MSVNSEHDCLVLAESLAGLLQAQRRRFLGDLAKFIATESKQGHAATTTAWSVVGAHQAHNVLLTIRAKKYVPPQLSDIFSAAFLRQMLEDPGIASHKQGVARLYFSRYHSCDHTKADELFWHDLSSSTSEADLPWLMYITRISVPLTYEIWLLSSHVFGDTEAVKDLQQRILAHSNSQVAQK
jgi:hypothetical protein